MTVALQTCLIVDDAEVDRRMMRRVVARQYPKMQIVFSHSLDEARICLADPSVSIVFLDNALPDGRGVDFVSELSEDRKLRRLPVVIVSDWPTPFMYAKARAANVCGVWSKNDFRASLIRDVFRANKIGA